jgi:hypothetical protein
VRGRFHKLRLAEMPPHPDLLPARGEKETAVRPGNVQSRRLAGIMVVSYDLRKKNTNAEKGEQT